MSRQARAAAQARAPAAQVAAWDCTALVWVLSCMGTEGTSRGQPQRHAAADARHGTGVGAAARRAGRGHFCARRSPRARAGREGGWQTAARLQAPRSPSGASAPQRRRHRLRPPAVARRRRLRGPAAAARRLGRRERRMPQQGSLPRAAGRGVRTAAIWAGAVAQDVSVEAWPLACGAKSGAPGGVRHRSTLASAQRKRKSTLVRTARRARRPLRQRSRRSQPAGPPGRAHAARPRAVAQKGCAQTAHETPTRRLRRPRAAHRGGEREHGDGDELGHCC